MDSRSTEKKKEGEEGLIKRKYTRSEMEALRFELMDYQLDLFARVYWGLEPTVKQVFDRIFVSDTKNTNGNRSDRRNRRRGKNSVGADISKTALIPSMIVSLILCIYFSRVSTAFYCICIFRHGRVIMQ